MRSLRISLLALCLGLLIAADASAQQAGWWDWIGTTVGQDENRRRGDGRVVVRDRDDRHERRDQDVRRRRAERHDDDDDDDWDDDDRHERRDGKYDRQDRNARKNKHRRKGNAPAFCRNGQGHPVHGRQWCIDKGYGLGNDGWYGQRRPTMERERSLEDIIFRRRGGTSDGRVMRRNTLEDILGRTVLGRLGAGRNVEGRWVPTNQRGAYALQLRSGGAPLAELTDYNGDGRVDLALVSRRR